MPNGVAILTVPLRPTNRKVAQLVPARSDVPGLGDQLDARERWILVNGVEKRGQLVDVVELAREDRRQIEPKSVDMHVGYPVAQ